METVTLYHKIFRKNSNFEGDFDFCAKHLVLPIPRVRIIVKERFFKLWEVASKDGFAKRTGGHYGTVRVANGAVRHNERLKFP